MYKKDIMKICNTKKEYRDALFSRGYLITTNTNIDYSMYPFYSNWKTVKINDLVLSVHSKENVFTYQNGDKYIILIGSALNPFDNEINEDSIIKILLKRHEENYDQFITYLNELTGIFVLTIVQDNTIKLFQDCHGMKSVFYGNVDNNLYISSHAQLISDINDLEMDLYIKKLINTKMYNMSNRYLPGDLSPYEKIKRLGPNLELNYFNNKFSVERFWPKKNNDVLISEDEIKETTKNVASILRNTMNLISVKWQNPAISLTGGIDSKTTLSSAVETYDKFNFFSYISKEQEKFDADAARMICDSLDLKHDIYSIPNENSFYDDFDIFKKIIDHNTSYYMKKSDNEIRKLIYFYKQKNFDVEVKSWGGETVRVFMDRKYNVTMPKTLNERHFSIFQTRYFLTPRLLRKSDHINYEFLRKIGLNKPLFNYEHSDLYYWEIRMGAWGSTVVNSFDLCHEAIMPLNNRKIITKLLSLPREIRINDQIFRDIIEENNPLVDTREHIKNLYFKSYRQKIEKTYYYYRTLFYKKKKL